MRLSLKTIFIYLILISIFLYSGCGKTSFPKSEYISEISSEKPLPLTEDSSDLEVSLDELVSKIVDQLPTGKKLKIAVAEFENLDGTQTNLERYISEELITKFVQSRRVGVIERRLLDKALSELKFNMSDLVDPEKAKRFGKQAGVDSILVGSSQYLIKRVRINSRLIDIATAMTIAVAQINIFKSMEVKSLIGKDKKLSGKKNRVELPGHRSTISSGKVKPAETTRLSSSEKRIGARREVREYRVGPGDILSIGIWERDEMREFEVEVRENGTISFMFLDDIDVLNLTLREIDKKLTEILKKYYSVPKVEVRMLVFKNL